MTESHDRAAYRSIITDPHGNAAKLSSRTYSDDKADCQSLMRESHESRITALRQKSAVFGYSKSMWNSEYIDTRVY